MPVVLILGAGARRVLELSPANLVSVLLAKPPALQ